VRQRFEYPTITSITMELKKATKTVRCSLKMSLTTLANRALVSKQRDDLVLLKVSDQDSSPLEIGLLSR
jgi:hypothetical protein